MFISAIITAAGQGHRFGSQKQFKPLDGKPLYQYSLGIFISSKIINEIILVVPNDNRYAIAKEIKDSSQSIVKVISGGAARRHSVKSGVDASSSDTDLVVIHDAARPFVTREMLRSVIKACEKSDGAIAAIPAVDTVKYSNDGVVEKTLDRNRVWLAQTPQAFKKLKLLNAYRHYDLSNSAITDESSIMEGMGYNISLVLGSQSNFKVTTKYDWKHAKGLLK